MLVELRKNVFVESTKVQTVFFSAATGQVHVQMDSGEHAFKVLEGEDPDALVPSFVEILEQANRSHEVVVTNETVTVGDATIGKTVHSPAGRQAR